jgi:hypothetical protein
MASVLSWLLVQWIVCDGKGDAEQETEEYKTVMRIIKKCESRSRKRKEFICRTMLFICKLILINYNLLYKIIRCPTRFLSVGLFRYLRGLEVWIWV